MADPLVTIMAFRDLPQALLAQGKLEAEGIESVLGDENIVRMDWFLANAMGGIKLQVPVEDADKALAVLNEEIPESILLDEAEEFVQPSCPKCGSLDIHYGAPGRGLQLAVLFVAPVPIPAGKDRWMCNSCGAHWEVIDET